MQSLTAEYNIEYPVFRELLRGTGGVVSGGAALAAYLKQEGQAPGFESNNMDVYLYADAEEFPFTTRNLYCNYLRLWGWTSGEIGSVSYPDNTRKIVLHETFTHPCYIKTINLFFVEAENMIEYIQTTADLSCTATWWDLDEGRFETIDPDMTLRRAMYRISESYHVRKEEVEERCQKYMARGFTLHEMACPHRIVPDLREALDTDAYPLQGKTAFDVFAYDDVDACEFLKQSSWHIILKAGEALYAFHRKMLYDYMKTKQYEMPLLCTIYDTPNHQSITEAALQCLQYSDHSIFELQHEYSTPVMGSSQKSVYTLHCYTVEQWKTGDPNESHFPPMYELDASSWNMNHIREQLTQQIGSEQYDSNLDAINTALSIIQNMQEYFHIQPSL